MCGGGGGGFIVTWSWEFYLSILGKTKDMSILSKKFNISVLKLIIKKWQFLARKRKFRFFKKKILKNGNISKKVNISVIIQNVKKWQFLARKSTFRLLSKMLKSYNS